jgi:hypothetical protein
MVLVHRNCYHFDFRIHRLSGFHQETDTPLVSYFIELHATIGKSERATTPWPSHTFMSYMDLLLPRRCHRLPLPCGKNKKDCLTEKDVDAVLERANWELSFLLRDSGRAEKLNRILIGSFLGELRERLFRHAKAALHRDDECGCHLGSVHRQHHHRNETFLPKAFDVYSAHGEADVLLKADMNACIRESRPDH